MNIRKATVEDAKGMARVHVDCWRSAYEGILPSDLLNNLSYKDREQRWIKNIPLSTSGGSMTFVVENEEGKIVGFALGGTMRDARLRMKYTGELYGLYVHPNNQQKGFGKKLFESVVHHLVSLHHSSIALWTFKGHHSCSFYNHLGGEKVYDKKTTIGGTELTEWAYGWDDLSSFPINIDQLN
ncbi:GNAT family N-acetyltransferase [Salipaludibacillus keqinensis]|uniref:GNAT family N-acetyltransferase n=1 Tax=Salipaludibacillus keqinensis TaxID=2045207 RepID=A0A323TMZ7_9BACI|nr:GNAT family N-acetyltransferase [Salipaludibacillus keqinensis]PYZ95037.1 GNAT family N-acetyltransferase [Salipaludibacillus keqinensis]